MANSKRKNRLNKEQQVKLLQEELNRNEAVLKKNTENLREQIQVGLYKMGYPPTTAMHDTLLERLRLDEAELKIKIDSGFKVINPTFEFQTSESWRQLQILLHGRFLKSVVENIAEIERNVEEVKKAINEQNERIRLRNPQILEELKKYGVDTSSSTNGPPDYVG